MPLNKVPLLVYVPPELRRAIRIEAARCGTTMQAVATEAFEQFLNECPAKSREATQF